MNFGLMKPDSSRPKIQKKRGDPELHSSVLNNTLKVGQLSWRQNRSYGFEVAVELDLYTLRIEFSRMTSGAGVLLQMGVPEEPSRTRGIASVH